MQIEDLLVNLNFCFLLVARLKESLNWWNGVVGPLLLEQAEGWCAKEILIELVAGGAATAKKEGRPTLERQQMQREFDATKGFPGEDGNPVIMP